MSSTFKIICCLLLPTPILLTAAFAAKGAALNPGHVNLLCHRTANEDVPENTLESLDQAALLGCDTVEIDLRRTLDGVIVLNHDGFLERLTDGTGEVEKTYFDDLELRDAGAWMGRRFEHLHIARFEDALRLAKKRDIRLILDIKTKNIGADVLMLVEREGMLERVQFGGEWTDVKELYPQANREDTAVWVKPGVTLEYVKARHLEGKAVIANFSANTQGMDVSAMKEDVAAGVDAINVDYPRLGADAVGRPVEARIGRLVTKAESGDPASRSEAILGLAQFRGFPLQSNFVRWLSDPDERVSRAAALALVKARPVTPASVLTEALRSDHPDVRANAAWALSMTGADATTVLPLLNDTNATVVEAALMALGRMHGAVSSDRLVALLTHPTAAVRGAAAQALARHDPATALKAIPAQLQGEVKTARALYEDYQRRGTPKLTAAEIETITGYFRCEMKMVQAVAMLNDSRATQALAGEAFRPGEDFSQMNGLVASFQLWDRLGSDPEATKSAVTELQSNSALAADRAEWLLIQAGPSVLPTVRAALHESNSAGRVRAIRILAWQGDTESSELLKSMRATDVEDSKLLAWAFTKIDQAQLMRGADQTGQNKEIRPGKP